MAGSMRTGCLAAIMTLVAGTLQADVLNLDDGSRIFGTLERLDAAQAKLSGTFNGNLTVPRRTIVRIETEEPVTVQLSDGAYLTGRVTTTEAEVIVVHVDKTGTRTVELDDVRGVYREDPLAIQRLELASEATGNANVGINLTSGNSQTQNLHLDGRLITRTKRNRYTLSGEYNQQESRDVLVKENWAGLVKYDYFVSDRWFWFNSVNFESNEFADLKLRSALAAGLGFQFFESEYRSLSIELGPSYIDENFETAEDENYLGSRWAVNYDQKLGKSLAFYHYHEGLLGLEDTDDLTIRSRTGLLMNLTDHIIARIQTAVDWDRSPPEGTPAAEDTKATDYQHTLTIGYAF
jgi:putative salt-induced outer membrane protein YdiY